MTTLVIAALTLAALAAVGYPLLARRPARAGGDDSAEGDGLSERRDSLYRDLRDLELDRRTGKVADADYEAMRQDFELEAARVLEEMERGRGDGRGPVADGGPACDACGAAAPAGARFCPSCGAGLAAPCPRCGAPVQALHRFCGACGAALPGLAAVRRSRRRGAKRRGR